MLFVKTGADEIPLSLLARAVGENKIYKIAPVFMQPEFTGNISKYEDVSVYESVKRPNRACRMQTFRQR